MGATCLIADAKTGGYTDINSYDIEDRKRVNQSTTAVVASQSLYLKDKRSKDCMEENWMTLKGKVTFADDFYRKPFLTLLDEW